MATIAAKAKKSLAGFLSSPSSSGVAADADAKNDDPSENKEGGLREIDTVAATPASKSTSIESGGGGPDEVATVSIQELDKVKQTLP
jgi:hypothetical protein